MEKHYKRMRTPILDYRQSGTYRSQQSRQSTYTEDCRVQNSWEKFLGTHNFLYVCNFPGFTALVPRILVRVERLGVASSK